MADTLELSKSVQDAVKAANDAHNATIVDDTKQTAPADDKKEPPTKEPPKDEKVQGLSADQLKEAEQLYNLFKDPEKAPAVIDWLARQAGYDKIKVETKQDVKEIKKDIKGILEEKLGPELSFLADKLAPAIDDILKEKLDEHTKDIRETLQQGELDKIAQQSETALESLSKEWFDDKEPPKEITARINELIDEMPAAKGMTAAKYMERLFLIAVGEKGLTKKSATSSSDATVKRAATNRNDAPSRLASDRGARSQQETTLPTRKMNLADAVALAAETVSKDMQK